MTLLELLEEHKQDNVSIMEIMDYDIDSQIVEVRMFLPKQKQWVSGDFDLSTQEWL